MKTTTKKAFREALSRRRREFARRRLRTNLDMEARATTAATKLLADVGATRDEIARQATEATP